MEKRAIIKVFGIVQGVGFRPFIHKLVKTYGFKGWVQNSTSGVTIDIEGEEEKILLFIDDIKLKAPELAVIEKVTLKFGPIKNYTGFSIIKSDCSEEGFVLISPDVATCSDCRRELMDPKDKRYRYPFINCTNCGPRFTIIRDLPYDREKTSMASFEMCSHCSSEYHDIENRRYHAQPNCCPECGPSLKLCDIYGRHIDGDPIRTALKKILEGSIVAIKGLGGFHLACNALDVRAVRELRNRKHREEKPFALMCRDVKKLKEYVHISPDEQKVLESVRRPIVLLRKLDNCKISSEVAPDTDYLGFMLPYTPLHYLLFEDDSAEALVMTSGNISDNPIVYKNSDAFTALKDIADYILFHDREIFNRCDDSVVKVIEGREYFIRRSRGYAPFPIKMDVTLKPMLACGGEQKASFCVSRGKYVFLSQHIGDLKNYETYTHYTEQIDNFKRLFKVEPEAVACDLHPDYLSTVYAESLQMLDRFYVQHHHAHMASCMADNNLFEDVIGVTWDGTGLGTDGTIWGGEFLVGNYGGFQRRGTFLEVPMPGGDKAVKEIYRMALSFLIKTYGSEFGKFAQGCISIEEREMDLIYQMAAKGINSPLTTSCGRLFDGVSCILGLLSRASYEGQGAIKLENVSDFHINDTLQYDVIHKDGMYIYDWRSTIEDIVKLKKWGFGVTYISSAFHNTVIEAAVKILCCIREDTSLNKVVLSGGVFQNDFILKKLKNRLMEDGFQVYTHHRVSTNDEGISLGQLMVAQNGGGQYVSGSTP